MGMELDLKNEPGGYLPIFITSDENYFIGQFSLLFRCFIIPPVINLLNSWHTLYGITTVNPYYFHQPIRWERPNIC